MTNRAKKRVSFIEITPDMADDMLSRLPTGANPCGDIRVPFSDKTEGKQRRSSARQIEKWIDLMKAGDWMISPDAISLCGCGGRHLINGQHRLRALKEAGVAAEFILYENCPEGMFAICDTGLKRSAASVGTMAGFDSRQAAAARAHYYLGYNRVDHTKSGPIRMDAPISIWKYVAQHPSIGEAVNVMQRKDRCVPSQYGFSRAKMSGLYARLKEIDGALADEWLMGLDLDHGWNDLKSSRLLYVARGEIYARRMDAKIAAERDGHENAPLRDGQDWLDVIPHRNWRSDNVVIGILIAYWNLLVEFGPNPTSRRISDSKIRAALSLTGISETLPKIDEATGEPVRGHHAASQGYYVPTLAIPAAPHVPQTRRAA